MLCEWGTPTVPDRAHYDTSLYFAPVSCLALRVCSRKRLPSGWHNFAAHPDGKYWLCFQRFLGEVPGRWGRTFLLELAFSVKSRMKYPSLHAVIKLACCPTLIITKLQGLIYFGSKIIKKCRISSICRLARYYSHTSIKNVYGKSSN